MNNFLQHQSAGIIASGMAGSFINFVAALIELDVLLVFMK